MIDMAPEHTSNVFVQWMNFGDSVYFATKKKYAGDRAKLDETMQQWEKIIRSQL